jgi:O-antigen/teichoic acid export membrane protein
MKIMPNFICSRISHRPNLLRIINNINWLFFDKILRMVVGMIVGLWFARYLGPLQFGVLSFSTAFVELFSCIAAVGMQTIVVRDVVRDPNHKEVTLGTAAALQFVGGIISYCILVASIFWFRPEDILTKSIVVILGSVMTFKFLDIAQYWFESQVQSKYTIWVQDSTFIVFSIIKVLLIMQGAPLIIFAFLIAIESLIATLILFFIFNIRGVKTFKLSIRFERAKTLLADGLPLFFSSISIMIYMRIDQIMISEIIGDKEVGIYSAAVRISELFYFIPVVILASIFPLIIREKQRSTENYNFYFQRIYDLMVWMSICVALPITIFSNSVVIFLFGLAYEGAGPVLAVNIWAGIFVALGIASSKWFVAENKQILSFKRTGIGAITNIILNFILIPKFGILGAAYATLASYAIAAMFIDLAQMETRDMFLMKLRAFNVFGVYKRMVFL